MVESPERRGPVSPAGMAAAVVCALEALVLLGSVLVPLVGQSDPSGSGAAVSVPLVATFVALAVILVALAVGWLRGRAWVRMATVVWNALLLPSALSLRDTWGEVPALVLVALACAGLAAALLSPNSDAVPS